MRGEGFLHFDRGEPPPYLVLAFRSAADVHQQLGRVLVAGDAGGEHGVTGLLVDGVTEGLPEAMGANSAAVAQRLSRLLDHLPGPLS